MKRIRWLFLCAGFLSSHGFAQVSFTLPAMACVNQSLSVSANSGTLVSPQITWLSTPNAIFSNSVAPNTNVTFTAVGNHTVLLVAISGTALAFTQQTIDVIANPTPTLTASSASVCPGSTFSITASPLSGANYSFGLPGSLTISNGTSNVLQINPPTILPAVFQVSVELGGCAGSSSLTVHQLQLHPQVVASTSYVCLGYGSTVTVFSGGTNYTFSIVSPSPAVLSSGSTPSFVASPTVPSVYQILTEDLGCLGTASISIGISPPLSINIIASSPTTCIMGNSPKISKQVTLSPSGASNYIWDPPIQPPMPPPFPGPLTVQPLQTTCYTVTGITAVCSGSAAICITVNPQFTVGIAPPTASICSGETLTLVSQIGLGGVGSPAAFTYSWAESSNSPTITMSSYLTPTILVFPQNLTTYSLEVWDTQTCVSLPQVATVQVFPCTGLNELKKASSFFTVFPNPAGESCVLKSLEASFSEVKLRDVKGRVVKTYFSPGGQKVQTIELDLSDIPPGVYFLQTNIPDLEWWVYKLVKF